MGIKDAGFSKESDITMRMYYPLGLNEIRLRYFYES